MFSIFVVYMVCIFSFYSELIFTDANFNITRSVFRTFGCGDQLHPSLVDIFVNLLNYLKKLKDPRPSSSGFFLSCNAYVSNFCFL